MRQEVSGISMKLGQYMFLFFLLCLGIVWLTVYTVQENYRLQKELDKIKAQPSILPLQFDTDDGTIDKVACGMA